MKIIKTNESLENITQIKDSTAALDPAMELAKEKAEDKKDEFEKIAINMDGELGAKKQPVPDKPKWTLDESLFREDYKNWDETVSQLLIDDKITSDFVVDFMYPHDQALEDMCRAFGLEDLDPYSDEALDALSEMYVDDLVEWISQHDELWDDFVKYCKDNLYLEESLGVSSSVELAARRDVTDYFQKMLYDQLLEDPIQASQLDVKIDSYNADWCPQDFNPESQKKFDKIKSLIDQLSIALSDSYFDDSLLESLKEDVRSIPPITKKEVTEFFTDRGFDVNAEDVQDYIDGVTEYINQWREEGDDYSIEQWYSDTRMNYPEDLEDLTRLVDSVKIPAPYDKRFMISEYEDEFADYQLGDEIDGYDCHFLAYLEPIDENDEVYPILTDDPDYPVCELVGERLIPVEMEDSDLDESLGDREDIQNEIHRYNLLAPRYDKQSIIDELINDGYSSEEAEYVANHTTNLDESLNEAADNKVTLFCTFEPYERYGGGGRLKKLKASGNDYLEAVSKLTDKMLLYIDSDRIEEDGMTFDEVINAIEISNGDGCDFIVELKDNQGNTYIQAEYENEYEDVDESLSESDIVTIGIYGDEIKGFSSVDSLVSYFNNKGIKVSNVDGDMDYGWEMDLTGPSKKLFFAVVNTVPGYNSDSVEDFIKQYRVDESLNEDTVKQNGKWVNKGDTGKTHGKFNTKKEADAQRKAMFVNNFKG